MKRERQMYLDPWKGSVEVSGKKWPELCCRRSIHRAQTPLNSGLEGDGCILNISVT